MVTTQSKEAETCEVERKAEAMVRVKVKSWILSTTEALKDFRPRSEQI